MEGDKALQDGGVDIFGGKPSPSRWYLSRILQCCGGRPGGQQGSGIPGGENGVQSHGVYHAPGAAGETVLRERGRRGGSGRPGHAGHCEMCDFYSACRSRWTKLCKA